MRVGLMFASWNLHENDAAAAAGTGAHRDTDVGRRPQPPFNDSWGLSEANVKCLSYTRLSLKQRLFARIRSKAIMEKENQETDELRLELERRPNLSTMVGFPPYDCKKPSTRRSKHHFADDLEEKMAKLGFEGDDTDCEILDSALEEILQGVSSFPAMENGQHKSTTDNNCKKEYAKQTWLKKNSKLLTIFHKTLRNSDRLSPSLRHLALKSLSLIAPTCEALLRSRKHGWIQLSGHAGAFFPAGPQTIWKKRLSKDSKETKAYETLSEDILSCFAPKFYNEVDYNNESFIEIEDLLQHFSDPAVMDIKMGTRTFMESEVKNPAVRKDLYEKMVKQSPDEPTPEEKEVEAISKLRYMQFRERESSTSTLGFRIEGIKLASEQPISSGQLKKTRSRDEVKAAMMKFLLHNEHARLNLIRRLSLMRTHMHSSTFFQRHELIGSSLLLMYDGEKSSAWMIDFAKTIRLPDDITINHRMPWQIGNHEDGYLTGLDNLIAVLQELKCS